MNSKYIEEAKKMSLLSHDPNTKVGCVIVKDDKIVSSGYNCLPKNLRREEYPLDIREGEHFETKYPYILHSEAMAIAEASSSLDGADIYVTLFPCNECAKLLIQAGIKSVYYIDDIYAYTDAVKASKRMLSDAGIDLIQVSL